MIQALGHLLNALRARGLAVSPAEAIDAGAALRAVELDSRETVRAALSATLAKGREESRLFEQVFDEIFRWQGAGRGGRDPGRASTGAGQAAGRARSESDRPAAGRTSKRAGTRPVEEPRLRIEARHRAGIPHRRTRLLLARPAAHEPSDGRETRPSGRRPAGGPARRESPRSVSGQMLTEDERRLSTEIPRLISEIRLRRGRRWIGARAGRLWLRAAARASLRTEGVPFVLPRRRRRLKPARVVLVVDVSWSAARASGLFLAIALQVLKAKVRCRVIAFVDRPVDVTERVRQWARGCDGESARAFPRSRRRAPGDGLVIPGGTRTFRELLESVEGLDADGASDFGRTFFALARDREVLRRDTILAVLGDGRSNRFDPQSFALEEIASRTGPVIWMVPEPSERWGTGDSALPEYLPHCDVVVETRDLDGLVRGVREILRRL